MFLHANNHIKALEREETKLKKSQNVNLQKAQEKRHTEEN